MLKVAQHIHLRSAILGIATAASRLIGYQRLRWTRRP